MDDDGGGWMTCNSTSDPIVEVAESAVPNPAWLYLICIDSTPALQHVPPQRSASLKAFTVSLPNLNLFTRQPKPSNYFCFCFISML